MFFYYMNELTPGEIKIVDFSSHPPFRPHSSLPYLAVIYNPATAPGFLLPTHKAIRHSADNYSA
jgi:hypothetical protein